MFCLKASPPPEDVKSDMVVPNNTPNPFTFPLSKVESIKMKHGSIKVVDSRTFKVADKISAVEVTVEVGGMRFVHKPLGMILSIANTATQGTSRTWPILFKAN
jgi:hypothetical protein